MNRIARTFALAALVAGSTLVIPAARADDPNPDQFVKMCDDNKDGMVSKAELMKHAEKMFEKVDKKKSGQLDKKQVEEFLKAFSMMSGG